MPTLKGEKVILRAVEKADINHCLKWFNNPEVIQYLTIYLPMTELAEEKWLEKVSLSEKDVVFIIEAIDSEGKAKPIGNCGLHGINSKDRNATFGIAIGEKDYWSKGYGTEATRLLMRYGFDELNLHRIGSAAYEFNERSIKMQQKIGFVIEGKHRQAIFRKGRYWDVINLGLLKEDFLKKN